MIIDKLQTEAHVWFVIPENIRDNKVITEFFSLLSTEEINKHNRFHFKEDKHQYLVSHAFVRSVLSKYLDKQPGDLKFHNTKNGKPEILLNHSNRLVRFNLSHTKGLTVCIVTMNDDCGIDTEKIDNKTASIDVARLMFSESEFEFIKNLSGSTYLKEFFTRWTLREAYVKALGLGIGYPTNKLLFNIVDDNNIGLLIEETNDAICQYWQFHTMQPTSNHIVSIAIKNQYIVQKRLIFRWLLENNWHNRASALGI